MLEIVCCRPADAEIAQENGATQLELCVGLEGGGLTPTRGLIQAVKSASTLPLFVMIRPRNGGYVFDAHEFSAMMRDADESLDAGADGLVFNVLTHDRKLDTDRLRLLLNVAEEKPCVLHRAFDTTENPLDSLKIAEDLGFRRILTAGGLGNAIDAAERLGEYQKSTSMEILPGGGIRAHNAPELMRRSGVARLHAAPHRTDPEDSNGKIVDAEQVRGLAAALAAYLP